MDSAKDIGQRLRLLRLALSEEDNQAEWVRSFHDKRITTGHWNNWEKGRDRPSLAAAILIAEKKKVTTDWIYQNKRQTLTYDMIEKLDAIERDLAASA